MKKIIILIISSIFIATILYVVFTKADYVQLTKDEALEIGEEKYLEFLWMVDGAFNDSKFDEEFTVNDKKLSDDKKIFTCVKNKKDNSCIGNNFEKEFERIFSANLNYQQVYGDGISYTWIKYENGKYIFTNIDSCSTIRMNTKQLIRINDINSNQLSFDVSSKDSNDLEKVRSFILVKENNEWKVSRAYYHDICEMDYNIG